MNSLSLVLFGTRLLFPNHSAPLGEELIAKVNKAFPQILVTQGWGMTETSPTSINAPPDQSQLPPGSIGILLANLEARLVDDAEVDVPIGERGELWLRGSNVMWVSASCVLVQKSRLTAESRKGYWRNPKATKESITPDGWLKTGDIATVDSKGHFFIVDRKKGEASSSTDRRSTALR